MKRCEVGAGGDCCCPWGFGPGVGPELEQWGASSFGSLAKPNRSWDGKRCPERDPLHFGVVFPVKATGGSESGAGEAGGEVG